MERSQLLNDPEQALRIAMDGQQSGLWTALPCIVTKVNWSELTVEAQPVIQGQVTDENGNKSFVNLPVLGNVPIVFPSAGPFALTLPIAPGDEVLVVFASRCIDSWWQNGSTYTENPDGPPVVQTQQPMENRMHDLSDGFAFPARMSQPKAKQISSPSQTNARLTTVDGSCFLEITPGGAINLTAPSGLNVTGNVVVTGNISATAEVTAQTAGTAIPLSTHIHPGVTTGTGDTGAPIP